MAISSGAVLASALLASCRTPLVSPTAAEAAFGGLDGALVVIDCSSGRMTVCRPDLAAARFPPCSTFKIVNALIGLEEGILRSPDDRLYLWDGVERSVPAWNRDLTLREAFQASCVPAFQDVARQVGPTRMQGWIDRLDYGNRDLSAGVDVFWLPSGGRRTIMISPREQAGMIQGIVAGEAPFSDRSLAVLKRLMFIRETARGRLYGKTGSGTDGHGMFVLGWFVGYVEAAGGRTYAFACVVQGEGVMSKEARAIVESLLEGQGLL